MGNLKNITVIDSTGLGVLIPPSMIFTFVGLTLLFTIGLYLLRSFGLYAMAKKENLKHPKLAFVPFVWIYTLSKLAGKVSFFGRKFKNFSGVAVAVCCITEFLMIFIDLVVYFPVVGYYLQGGEITFVIMGEGLSNGLIEYPLMEGLFLRSNFVYPYATHTWFITMATIFSYAYDLFSIAEVIVLVMIYIGFFRRYWPDHNFLGTLLAIFGLFPIVVFALRKRNPVDYEKYMRAKFYGVYANNQQNPEPPQQEDTDPFGYDNPEQKKDDEPFSEFNDNDDRRE